MSGSTPHVIGIAGPSGSGKTTLARILTRRLRGGGVVVGLDAYYRDQRGVPDDALNVDEPAALDHELLIRQVSALARGEAIRQPVYDYGTHSRLDETSLLEPAPWVIVDGLFALYWEGVRALMQTSFFLALAHEACLERRLARDVVERGRSEAAVRMQYERSVRPMYDRHVHPTRVHAGLILDATRPIETIAQEVLEALPRGGNPRERANGD